MIRNILFDLGNVLVPINWDIAFDNLEPVLIPKVAELMRVNSHAFKKLFLSPTVALETGQIEFEEFFYRIRDLFKPHINVVDLENVWTGMFSLDEDMARLGACLSKEYDTWLVSNTSRIHYEHIISQFPAVAFYNDAALSYKIGAMKPSQNYYRRAIAQFGIEPAESIFIDDIVDNVLGAVKAGMIGIIFEGYAELRQEFDRLGIDTTCVGRG